MQNKRLSILIAGAAVSALALSACGGGGKTPAEPGDSPADEQVTITVFDAYAAEEPHGQYVYQYAEAFMKANPNIKVEITAIASNDIFAKLAAMATDPSSLPTLYFTSGDQAPSLYDLGFTEDLAGHLDDAALAGLAPSALEAAKLGGATAFYPLAVQPLGVLYRIDRFEEANVVPPTTWDEFLTAAKALTTTEGEDPIAGFGMIGSNNSSGQSRFLSYLWSSCLDVISQDAGGSWVTDVDSPEFLKAFTFWTEMNDPHHVVPTGITSVDYPTAANYFAMGFTNMMMTGGNALGVAYNSNPELKGKIGSFPIPGCAGSQLNAEGLALSAHATDAEKAAAVAYLKFFAENDPELMFWQSSGKIPATTEGQQAEFLQGADYAGLLETIEKGTVPVVNFPGMAAVKTALGNAYSAVFSGEADNAAAVATLKTEIDQILAENQ